MKISPLFFIFIFSLIIFERGLINFDLNLLCSFIYAFIYSLSFFVLEIITKYHINKQIFLKKFFIFYYCVMLSSFSFILWLLAICYYNSPFLSEAVWGTTLLSFFVLMIFFFLIVIFYWANINYKKNFLFNMVCCFIIILSAIFLISGNVMLSKCSWHGCKNIDYLSDRASKENKEAICEKAGEVYYYNTPILSPSDYPQNIKTGHKYSCYYELAIKKNNPELCKRSKDEDGCYSQIAENFNNYSVCKRIRNQFMKDWCLFSQTKKQNKNRELNATSSEINNEGDCENIIEETLYSKYVCYKNLAQEKKDPQICRKIDNQEIKSNCFLNLAKIIKNVLLCDELPEGVDKTLCFSDTIDEQTDPQICRNIIDEWYKLVCLSKVALKINNPKLCNETKQNTHNCLADIAKKTNNPDICLINPDIKVQSGCFYFLAQQTNDIKFCEKISTTITNSLSIDSCYEGVAIKLQNSSICEKITYEKIKKSCIEYIQKYHR
jgi:hypothetical protein